MVRKVLAAFFWTLVAILLLVVGATVIPTLLGLQAFVVYSGSMAPYIHAGDAIVVRPISPASVKVGDVITFRSPGQQESLVTHRVVGINVQGDQIIFRTKGDANASTDIWSTPADGVVGSVLYPVPFAGYLIHYGNTLPGKLLLVALPALLLILGWILPGLPWRRPAKKREGEEG